MFEAITKLYAPYECLGCQLEGGLLCSDCSERLRREAERCYRCHALSPLGRTCENCRRYSRLYAVHVATSYEDVAKELVGKLKFSGARSAAGVIAQAMARSHPLPGIVIVPVPTATSRVRLRGYDQATLIAKELAGREKLLYLPCLLRSGQHRQVGASRQERLRQMNHSFMVRHTDDVRGRHLVLVDDVVTTGASLESAAMALKAAGAARVEAIVFARA